MRDYKSSSDLPLKERPPGMKLSTAAICLLALFATLPAFGSDVFYTIDSTSGTPGFTGSFEYDTTGLDFVSFTVAWDGLTYDLTSSANSPSIGGAPTCAGGLTGAAASFFFLTNCTSTWEAGGEPSEIEFMSSDSQFVGITLTANAPGGVASPGGAGVGGFPTFQVSQVPEPSAMVLTVIGLGWVMRKQLRARRGLSEFSK
jgi:hypothetical protein